MRARDPSDQRLRPQDRLKNSREFSKVMTRGQRWRVGGIVLIWLPSDAEHSRIGFVVGKGAGCAPLRNLWKRRWREAFRQHRHALPFALDLVIQVRGPVEVWNVEKMSQTLHDLELK